MCYDSLCMISTQQTAMVDVIASRNGDGGARGSVAGEGRTIGAPKRCTNRLNSKCKTCPNFCETNNFTSTVTGSTYEILNNTNQRLSCNSRNVVYLLSCKHCLMQYVGKTKQQFNIRNNAHRRSTVKENIHTGCPLIHEHFTQGPCTNADYTCHIIEKISDNGSEAEQLEERRRREMFWIKELRTVYPFGLNSRADTNQGQFNKMTRYEQRIRGRKRGKDIVWNIADIFETICMKYKDSYNELIRYCSKMIPQIPRPKLKLLAQKLLDVNIPDFIMNIIINTISKKQKVNPPEKYNEHKRSKNQLKINFACKGIEMINVGKLIHDAKESFPLDSSEKPMIVYKYTRPIRNKIVNYRQTVQEADFEQWQNNEDRCECHNSPFKDEFHNHVITGDLSIVKNIQLRDILRKGPNYREPRTLDWRIVKKEINIGLSNFITQKCEKEGIPTTSFSEWKVKIMEAVTQRITLLKQRYPYYRPSKSILRNDAAAQELSTLHEKYVITVVDKASKNYAFVCKWFYMKVLYEEIGATGDENETYLRSIESENAIVNRQINGLDPTNIKVPNSDHKLPFIYWIPKFHKTPVKSRYIVSSAVCATKKLASMISKSLKLIMKGRKKYCSVIEEFTGTNRWWISENNQPVLQTIKEINEKQQAKAVVTYDFSTLYTKIPHDKLKLALNNIVEKCFEKSKMKYISINNYEAFWSDRVSKRYTSFNKTSLLNNIDFLIDNTFFMCGDLIFKQNIGIPMGTDPGPDFANLFLHFYEFKYMESNTRTNYGVCKRISKCSRYIDDVIFFNSGDTFETIKADIYPNELILNKENEFNNRATFLDIDIMITDKIFSTRLYDKRNDFNFQIVNFPFLCGNIPKRQSYGVFTSQLIRFSRVCSKYEDFSKSCKGLIMKLLKQGYETYLLKRHFSKLPINYLHYNLPRNVIIVDIFSQIE